MRSDVSGRGNPWPRPVLAATTVSVSEFAPEPPRLPSLISDSLGPRAGPRASSSMRLTERDERILELVWRTRALRDDQVQVALFSPGARSRCQLRLTLLVRNRYLDRLPRRLVNEPAVYVLSRRSVVGNRLLRQRFGDAEFRRHMTRIGSLGHLLAVNDVRVQAERASQELGWSLRLWQTADELRPILARYRLIPDAYFQIQRRVEGEVRTSAFFLELERANKSSRVVESKLSRYGELYYSGRYQDVFGTRALRLLLVFANDLGTATGAKMAQALDLAQHLGVSIARFAALDSLKTLSPSASLSAPVWWQPGQSGPVPLFRAPGDAEENRHAHG